MPRNSSLKIKKEVPQHLFAVSLFLIFQLPVPCIVDLFDGGPVIGNVHRHGAARPYGVVLGDGFCDGAVGDDGLLPQAAVGQVTNISTAVSMMEMICSTTLFLLHRAM